MAGDWIKMRGNLWDDPRVARICDLTDCGEAHAIGALYWLWATADQHTEDGCMPGLTLRQIDRKTGLPGFGAALIEVGWLRDDPQGVVIANFEEHNGASAKKRCQTAKRVALHRSGNVEATPDVDAGNATSVTGALAREEKRREEEPITSLLTQAPAFPAENRQPEPPQLCLVEAPRPKARTVPDCPHQAILALWAEVLPALPQHNPGMWTGTRADHLRARWRETAASKGWESESEGLTYFRRLFGYIGQSAFLTGKAKPAQGKPPFIAELAWVVSPQSWAKVHEGKYHSEAA